MNKLVLIAVFSFLFCFSTKAQDTTNTSNSLLLTPELKAKFTKDGELAVKQLENALGNIVDKTRSYDERAKNKENALNLFSTDTNRVEITSVKNQNNKISRQVKIYLSNLLNLAKKYDAIKITYFDTRVSNEFIPKTVLDEDGNIVTDEDGNPVVKYFGYATFCQVFEARTLNASAERFVQYNIKNIDCKRVQIIIEKMKNAKDEKVWILRLGDITVEEYNSK